MRKVYINNKPVYLRSSQEAGLSNQDRRILQVTYKDVVELKKITEYINRNKDLESTHILGKNDAELWNDFLSLYLLIDAAGGMVFNERNEVLLIYRNNTWDLPKGKVEKGETIEEAAVREVMEETGLQQVNILAPVDVQPCGNVTYHTYIHPVKKRVVLKTTYWYLMRCETQAVIPQQEEGITEVRWVPIGDLPKYEVKTYGSIRDVMVAGRINPIQS